jgi:hypothetical protein
LSLPGWSIVLSGEEDHRAELGTGPQHHIPSDILRAGGGQSVAEQSPDSEVIRKLTLSVSHPCSGPAVYIHRSGLRDNPKIGDFSYKS